MLPARRLLATLSTGGVPTRWRPADPEAPDRSLARFLDVEALVDAGIPADIASEVAAAAALALKPIQRATLEQYVVAVERLARTGRLPHEAGSEARRSYGLYRSALLRVAGMGLLAGARAALASGRDTARSHRRGARWLEVMEQLAAAARLCRTASWSVVAGAGNGSVGRAVETSESTSRRRHGNRRGGKAKRAALGRLPPDWREQCLAAAPVGWHPYALALRVVCLTGARPAELVAGATLRLQDDGKLLATVPCAKRRAGEPPRTRTLEIDPHADGPTPWDLIHLLDARGEELIVRIDSAKAFSDAVRALGRRLFPDGPSIAPISFRHGVAADAKATVREAGGAAAAAGGPADDAARAEVALVLGHGSLRSQGAYGLRRQSRTGHRLAIRASPEANPAPRPQLRADPLIDALAGPAEAPP